MVQHEREGAVRMLTRQRRSRSPASGRAVERKEHRSSRFFRIVVLVLAVVGLLVVAAIMLLVLAGFVQDITPSAGL